MMKEQTEGNQFNSYNRGYGSLFVQLSRPIQYVHKLSH